MTAAGRFRHPSPPWPCHTVCIRGGGGWLCLPLFRTVPEWSRSCDVGQVRHRQVFPWCCRPWHGWHGSRRRRAYGEVCRQKSAPTGWTLCRVWRNAPESGADGAASDTGWGPLWRLLLYVHRSSRWQS